MKFRVFVFLFFITAFLCFSQEQDEEWYRGKPIRDIIFTGLQNVTQAELEPLMNPYKGRIFDDNIFWEIQGRLYALEYFDRIEPYTIRANPAGSEVIIRFNVVERPHIDRIIFTGNSGLSRRELNDVIISRVNGIFNQSKVRLDIEAITNKYIEKGYPNVTVTATESQSGDSSITLIFNIVEREQISISKIEFQGNSRFSANTLRGQLSLKTRSLLNDGAFQEAKLLADREAVTKYYRDRGYIDAQVVDVTRTFETDSRRTNMILTFMISEGTEFKFGGITFEGNIIFSEEQLSRLISSRVGDTVNMTRLEMDMQRVADLYFENGYIYNSLIRTPEKNTQTNTLSYSITIVERSRAYIENIIILGNHKTKDEVILREIPMEPGDVFSRTKILDALRNLYNLQFFSMVIPDTLQGSTENLMDLVFTFEEQPTTDVQFGLTFAGSADPDSFPISGLLKWNDRNLAGYGNQLGVEVNSSVVDTTALSINYLHRWVFGLPLSLGIDFTANYSRRHAPMNNSAPWFEGNEPFAFPDGFSSRKEYEDNNKVPTRDYLMPYDQWYLSLGFSSGYRWPTAFGNFGLNGGARVGITYISYDDELYRPFDPVLRESNNDWTPRNSIWTAVSLDQRDIFYDPSRGYYLYNRTSFQGIIEGEREYYIRNDSKAQYYLTLFDIPVTENWSFKNVLAFHVGLSTIFAQPGREMDGKPKIVDGNKLAVDGMFIGRGWNSEFANKGLLLLDSWVEMRFPLVRGLLAFDLFFETAGVDTEEGYYFKDFGIDNLRFGFGGGFRFAIPQFPIRISLVKRFKIPDDRIEWQKGALFASNDPEKKDGLDIVMSFVLSY
ncbi:MAG: outer membrane protein assembly factor BamA [Treponema sp.]|nr:outer membrane protein assembly factor BamA [Treponema sp.]